MSESTIKDWTPIITGLVSSVASVTSAWLITRVHRLVNSQFSGQLNKNADTSDKLAIADPTEANIKSAAIARQIADDHK